MYSITLEQFKKYAKEGNLIPVYGTQLQDMSTAFNTFTQVEGTCLLESFNGGKTGEGGKINEVTSPARYSIMVIQPYVTVRVNGMYIVVEDPTSGRRIDEFTEDALSGLKHVMSAYHPVDTETVLPPFYGGAIGYFGCNKIWQITSAQFALCKDVMVYDNVKRQIYAIANAHTEGVDPEAAYTAACARIDQMLSTLVNTPSSFMMDESLEVYRGLRILSPSTHMHYFKQGPVCLAGASSNTLVRIAGQNIYVAGDVRSSPLHPLKRYVENPTYIPEENMSVGTLKEGVDSFEVHSSLPLEDGVFGYIGFNGNTDTTSLKDTIIMNQSFPIRAAEAVLKARQAYRELI